MFFTSNKIDNIDKDTVFSSEELFHLVNKDKSVFEKVLVAGKNGNLSCQIYISEFYDVYLQKLKDELSAEQHKLAESRYIDYTTMSASQGHRESKDRLIVFYLASSDGYEEITKDKIDCLEQAIYWYEDANGVSDDDDFLIKLKNLILDLCDDVSENVRKQMVASNRELTANFYTKSLNNDTNNIVDYKNVLNHIDVVFKNLTDARVIKTRITVLNVFCLISSAGGAKDEGDMVYLKILMRVLGSQLRYLNSAPQGTYNYVEIELLELTVNEFNKLNSFLKTNT